MSDKRYLSSISPDAELTNWLTRDHPSFGVERAGYLLHLDEPFEGAQLVVVTVEDAWKVVVMEVLAGTDGQLAEGIQLLAVFRHCDDCGLRSDDIAPMSYLELTVGRLPYGRLIGSAVMATAFRRSLSEDDRRRALRILDTRDDDEAEPSSGPASAPSSGPSSAPASGPQVAATWQQRFASFYALSDLDRVDRAKQNQ